MDPSFLFRSPLLSDAENNNLMAAAAAAEKARALMMMGARPPGPIMPPPPLFPSSVPTTIPRTVTTSSASLPQLYKPENLSLISHWSAIHQAALLASAEAAKRASPPTSSPGVRPLFPGMPPMRFTPYIVPPKRSNSPSPPPMSDSPSTSV